MSYRGTFQSLTPFRFAFGNIVILLLLSSSTKHVKTALYVFRAKLEWHEYVKALTAWTKREGMKVDLQMDNFQVTNFVTVTSSCFNSFWWFFLKKPTKTNTALQHFWTALKPLMQGPIETTKLEGLWFGTGIQAEGELYKKEGLVGGRQTAAGLRCGHVVDLHVFERQK